MNLYRHARLTPRGRALLVERVLGQGLRVEDTAQAAGVSVRTAYKWLRRFEEEGPSGLLERLSRPHHCPHATPPLVAEQVLLAWRQRQTYHQIAQALPGSASTIARLSRRAGLHRLAELAPARPDHRYEYAQPGELLHLDIKKLGRLCRPGHRLTGDRRHASDGAGWEYVHVAIDDHSRVGFCTLHPNERGSSACRAPVQALRHDRSPGVRVERVMTDNGACCKSRRFRRLVRRLGLRHVRTRPYTPRTNGKAERFIQTALREWADVCAYDRSEQRAAALPHWLHRYNWHRPHTSLAHRPPVSRIPVNNLLALHS